MATRGPKRKIKAMPETDGAGTERQAHIPQRDAPEPGDEGKPAAVETSETITLPEASEGKPIKFAQPEVATHDMWRYHPDHEPRIFRAGEPIPAGWTGPKGILGKFWKYDDSTTEHGKSDTGRWVRVEEKPK